MARLLSLVSGACVAILIAALPVTAAADCQCRSNGEYFVLGEHTCIKTNEGYRLARCDMVLNNTSWVVVGYSCPMTSLPAADDLKGRLFALAPRPEATLLPHRHR